MQSIRRLLVFLSRTANATGTLVVLALVSIVNADVIARNLFNAPFRGAVEVVEFSMVMIVFLQLPDVLRVNRLTRSDGFLAILRKRNPRAADILNRVIDTVTAAFMALIAYVIFPEIMETWKANDYFGTPGVFAAPWWPVKTVIVLSATLTGLICLYKLAKGVAPLAPSEERKPS